MILQIFQRGSTYDLFTFFHGLLKVLCVKIALYIEMWGTVNGQRKTVSGKR